MIFSMSTTTTKKNIKHLKVNLTKDVQNNNGENYKNVLKNIKGDLIKL